MSTAHARSCIGRRPPATTEHTFYRDALRQLQTCGVPFLVGGAYALAHYGAVLRETKDFDIFVRPADCERTLETLAALGFRTEVTFTHWLAKAHSGEHFIDVIFGSGNGICGVDDDWFTHAVKIELWGVPVKIVPPEEMIWSKAFIMARDRYDGADIAHVLRLRGGDLDWARLLARFDRHWRVLLSHLVLFGFIYPTERARIPSAVLQALLTRMTSEPASDAPAEPLCRGTLLAIVQYQTDVDAWGYCDARLLPEGNMTSDEVARWTSAFTQS